MNEVKDNKKIFGRDGANKSLWQAYAWNVPGYTHAKDPIDVLVVGGGITGITTALLLQQTGCNCLLVEKDTIGFGTTGGTTAHLNTFFDTTYPEIESKFDTDAAQLMAQGGKEALDTIARLIQRYQIDCDFEYKDAYLFAENEKEGSELQSILQASRKVGIAVDETHINPIDIPFHSALCFERQAQFHPLKYASRLADEFVKLGGTILTQTCVKETSYEDGLHHVACNPHTTRLRAKHLVYATHIPPGINLLSFRCAPYRSYVLGLKLKDQVYPKDLVYDMQEPYHYFRTHVINDQPYLILGGEDHKTGHDDPQKAFEKLEAYARQYFHIEKVAYKWSSQYYVPVDGLPYIGQLPGGDEHTYVATGFNGNGMVFGTLSAKIISDIILNKPNAYADLLTPSRAKPVAAFTSFVKENADVVYHFFADRLATEDLDTMNQLPNGTGKVVDFQSCKLAIYKDDAGQVTALNPICKHAGCYVAFNAAEKSWDCPCHGGRYDCSGRLLNGPPTENLETVPLPAPEMKRT